MVINDYSFGRMVVDGKEYLQDLIIFPDRIVDNWQRKEGHILSIDDLSEVIEYAPDILIVGTGSDGVLKILPETIESIKNLKIKLIAKMTLDASKIFNEYNNKKLKVVGVFHLTC